MKTFEDITKEMTELYHKKNKDYGNSFDQSLNEFGIIASIVRMNDKMNRVKQLCANSPEVKSESIQDTLIDLANYAIMTVSWMNK